MMKESYTKLTHIASVPVIICNRPGNPLVSIEITIAAGGKYETLGVNDGVAHFLEHMMYKGGGKYIGLHNVRKSFNAIGAMNNAKTNKETIRFFGKCIGKNSLKLLDLLLSLVFQPGLDREKFEKEKTVVLEEIQNKRTIQRHRQEHRMSWLFPGSPLGKPNMGSYEDIEKMEYNLILDYYRNHVACDKVIIGISGGLGEESAYIDMIQSYLLGVPQQGIWEYQTSEITKEKSYVNVTNVDKKGENERIYYYSSVDGYPAGTKEYIKHLFVSKLLGGMTYSRLFLHLREEKALCYDISTSILAYKDRGLLILNGSCRNKDSDYIQKYFEQEYQSIVQGHLSDEEFSITQDKLITDTYFQMETTDLEIAQLNYRYLMTGKLWTQEDIMKEFAGITKDSLLSLSKDTYNFKHFTHY